MMFHIQLSVLCVAIACSGYIGYLSGIHSQRNHAYKRGYKKALNNTYGKHNE